MPRGSGLPSFFKKGVCVSMGISQDAHRYKEAIRRSVYRWVSLKMPIDTRRHALCRPPGGKGGGKGGTKEREKGKEERMKRKKQKRKKRQKERKKTEARRKKEKERKKKQERRNKKEEERRRKMRSFKTLYIHKLPIDRLTRLLCYGRNYG